MTVLGKCLCFLQHFDPFASTFGQRVGFASEVDQMLSFKAASQNQSFVAVVKPQISRKTADHQIQSSVCQSPDLRVKCRHRQIIFACLQMNSGYWIDQRVRHRPVWLEEPQKQRPSSYPLTSLLRSHWWHPHRTQRIAVLQRGRCL